MERERTHSRATAPVIDLRHIHAVDKLCTHMCRWRFVRARTFAVDSVYFSLNYVMCT